MAEYRAFASQYEGISSCLTDSALWEQLLYQCHVCTDLDYLREGMENADWVGMTYFQEVFLHLCFLSYNPFHVEDNIDLHHVFPAKVYGLEDLPKLLRADAVAANVMEDIADHFPAANGNYLHEIQVIA
mmetsp:Transcript_16610/g.16804  ORF Transcript_16610/g.16804 Transcript_16610/m.16804 type:complete len:129 (-) Transcript_16610:415-801(-)